MSTSYIDAFVEAAQEVFSLALGTTLKTTPCDLPEGSQSACEVTALIGLNGSCRGTVVISLDGATALNIVEAILGVRPERLDADVLDAVGELTNMIAGGGKTRLKQLDVTLGLPMVIRGASQSVLFPAIAVPQKADLVSSLGTVQLQVGLAQQRVESSTRSRAPAAC